MGRPHRGTARIGRHAQRIAVALAVLASTAGPGVAAASAHPPVRAEIEIPSNDIIQPADCPVDVPAEYEDRVECGVLTVPERRDAGADPERVIELPFAIVASAAREPEPDPLVFPTSGGPGGGSLESLWYFLGNADWATDTRDVIVVEQRGDRLSNPTLDCPELRPERFYVDGAELTGASGDVAWEAAVTACRDRLIADGVDLSAYTSAASAADLADLRAALGYDQWNLYGISYGARLSLTVMRDRPEGLRAVVLDGAYPPNIDSHELRPAGFVGAVDALMVACHADSDCHARYPQLRTQLLDVLDRAAENPFVVTVRSPADGSVATVEVDDRDLGYGLFNALYDAGSIGILPFVIDRLAQGDAGPLMPLTQQSVDAEGWIAEGQNLSIECAEEFPFESAEELDAAYGISPLTEHLRPAVADTADCAIWGVPALGENENAVVTSAVPTLLMVGGYDPITPLAWNEAAAVGLSAHRLYVFPTMSHGSVWQTWFDDCPASIAAQFLTDPALEPDSSCIAGMEPTNFLTSSDIHPTTAVYRVAVDLVQLREPIQVGFAIAAVVVFVGTLVYAAVYGVLRAARRTDEAAAGTVLAATTTSGFFLAFVAALALVLLTTNQLVLAMGIPPAAWLLFLLPMIAIAVGVLLVVLLVLAWMRDDGGRQHRVVFSITAVFAIAFGVWLLFRGLLFV